MKATLINILCFLRENIQFKWRNIVNFKFKNFFAVVLSIYPFFNAVPCISMDSSSDVRAKIQIFGIGKDMRVPVSIQRTFELSLPSNYHISPTSRHCDISQTHPHDCSKYTKNLVVFMGCGHWLTDGTVDVDNVVKKLSDYNNNHSMGWECFKELCKNNRERILFGHSLSCPKCNNQEEKAYLVVFERQGDQNSEINQNRVENIITDIKKMLNGDLPSSDEQQLTLGLIGLRYMATYKQVK